MIRRYGWRPSLPDHRDHIFRPKLGPTELPSSVNLRNSCPPVYDQGQLGSCTANAIAAAVQFDEIKQSLYHMRPSRLFIYYNERDMEGTVDYDSGAYIRDGFKSIATQGVCSERLWPYDESRFADKPSAHAYARARIHKALEYTTIYQDEPNMKGCLADGYPIVIGFSVYESFESDDVARTGIVPMPAKTESLLGGHAVLIVGYDDDDDGGRFLVRNSWGDQWGIAGYFTIPYPYFTDPNLSDDLWTVRVVSGTP
jgi:C1A family cysteine protease